MNEDYSVNEASLEAIINKSKEENSFLFKAQKVNVVDGTPSTRKPTVKQPDEMSREEIEKLLKSKF